jgi:alpha-methylacyl-CoA racemase
MGPLKGMRVIEFGGLAPGPFCAQMLADMGADILRIDRKGPLTLSSENRFEVLQRNRTTIDLNLKKPEAVETALQLIEQVDALIEGFRPGVMEDLGLGPDICLQRNPRLIYGRITGWGQEGPLAKAAGHDINYIALSGVLHAIGEPGRKPVPPLNLIGDFGGGGLLLAFGIMCGLYEVQRSGQGQVVDAAMVDGSAALAGMIFGMKAAGIVSDRRGTNLLDGGAYFYDTYETADGRWVAIGSIEPQFYALLLEHTGIDDPAFQNHYDVRLWPECREKLAEVFKTKTRDEWCRIMEGTDVCFAPVLTYEEAFDHPHNVARETFIEVDGVRQPAPAPRFSRTRPEVRCPPTRASGAETEALLRDWGIEPTQIDRLRQAGAI